jgi:hypothetical protein
MHSTPRPETAAKRTLRWLGRLLTFSIGAMFAGTVWAADTGAGPTVVIGGSPGRFPSDTTVEKSPGAERLEAAAPPRAPLNNFVTDAVAAMPAYGGYRANSAAIGCLRRSIQLLDSRLIIDPAQATPSFCSSATYLVFLSVLNRLNREGAIRLDEATLRALLIQDPQPDGAGVWGRWNANGPGTARLFYETGLGPNFTSLADALPGDFLKIFWNDEIGAREHGHSVVYLGTETKPEGEFVQFWSSNEPDGFGVHSVPRPRIRRMLFSRLETPGQILRVTSLPARDSYLAALLKKSSSVDEMDRMTGIADIGARPWYKRLLHF